MKKVKIPMKNNRFNILKTTAMRNAWVVVFVVAGTTLTATSCADDGAVASGSRQKVQLLVSVPTQTAAASQHRLVDPGTAVPEGTDWDRLTVILAYADGSRVIKTTLTKTDFEALADYDKNHPGVKLLTIDAWLGEAYIYGVTYSSGVAGDPETAINACQSNKAVQGLTISNTYASGDVAKFVSVATGYYQTSSNNQPAPFTVTAEGVGLVSNLPTITLTRLATKIDVQWDVADAYDKGYTDMKLTKFSLTGTTSGYLFPAISGHSALTLSDPPVTFTNTTPISQRNGRQYHYTFTDGVTKPTTITFKISGKQNGTTEEVSKNYTLNFQKPLQPATWYKVNATISGMEGATDYTLSNFE